MSDQGRVGILISGRGSNMLALLEAMRDGRIAAEPAVVISNKRSAAGLVSASELGVPTEVIPYKGCASREEHEREIVEVLRRHRVDLVCLAGYMRLLSPYLVSEFRDRILNVHPALLPAFPGLHAQQQAIEYGVKVSGCTVHLVDEECDHGPIVMQAAVPVDPDDDEESLSARILEQEHRIYVEAVAAFFESGLAIDGRRVRLAARTRPAS